MTRPTDNEGPPRSVAEAEADVEGPPQSVVRRGGTFRAFRYRDYSLFWSGALVSNVGSWMQMYALSIVVYGFRRSELDLGIVNLIGGLPVLFLALPAGALADRVDRRKLLIWAQAALMLQAAALGFLYANGYLSAARPVLSLALVSLLGLFGGVWSALTFPAWQSTVPDIVPREDLLNAIALNAAQFQSARLLGPLAASALLLAGATMGDVFYVNAASFLFVIAALALMRFPYATARPARSGPREGAMKTLTAGLSYARHDRVVGLLILSVAMMTIFGMPYMMLLPALADKALNGGKLVVGWLMAANGLGAAAGALVVASLPKGLRREPIVPWTLLAMSLLLVGLAFSRVLWVSLILSALAGAAFLTSASLMNTSIQSCVPDRLRGRVMALFIVAFMGLMPISSIIFGSLGSVIGPMNAVIIGAVILAGYSIVLVFRPELHADRDCGEVGHGEGPPEGSVEPS